MCTSVLELHLLSSFLLLAILPPSFPFLVSSLSHSTPTSSPPSLTSSLGMDHPLWDSLPVEVSHLIEVHSVLHHLGPTGAHGDDVLLVINWNALAGGQSLLLLYVLPVE